jgi:hypothetical protein
LSERCARAIGYLLKNVTAFELVQAIRAAHAGRSLLAQEATAALWQAYSSVACAARLCCPWGACLSTERVSTRASPGVRSWSLAAVQRALDIAIGAHPAQVEAEADDRLGHLWTNAD